VSLRLFHAAKDWNSCCVCQRGSTQIYVQIRSGDQTIDIVRSKLIRDLISSAIVMPGFALTAARTVMRAASETIKVPRR